jgi:ATP-dependent Lon protease
MNFKIGDKVLEKVIQDYTRESGVRELDRQLASIMRYQAKEFAMKGKLKAQLTQADVEKVLGKSRYSNDLYKVANMPGVAVGLAWTYVGGDILFVETSLSDGKGDLKLTGNLGNVMKESAVTAFTYLQSNARKYDIDPEDFNKKTLHVHVPEGAVPKGRAQRRRHHDELDGLCLYRQAGETLSGDDRRDHLTRSGTSGRRNKRKDPCCQTCRSQGDHPLLAE